MLVFLAVLFAAATGAAAWAWRRGEEFRRDCERLAPAASRVENAERLTALAALAKDEAQAHRAAADVTLAQFRKDEARLSEEVTATKQQNYQLRLMLEHALKRATLSPDEAERVLANANQILSTPRPGTEPRPVEA